MSGNYIGVDVTGNSALPNITHGIDIAGDVLRLVIGTNGDGVNDQIEGNTISGNVDDGIRLSDGRSVTIAGNNIGVGADGVSNLGNGKRGILITDDPVNTVIGYAPTMSNSDANIVGNLIRYNGDCAIGHNSSAQDVLMRRNTFGFNAGIAIDLGYDLVTGNDADDSDAGSNGLLNYPVISKVRKIGNALRVEGFTRPGTLVELYIADGEVAPAPLPVGYSSSFGEGSAYLTSGIEGSTLDDDSASQNYPDNGTGSGISINEARFSFLIPTAAYNHLLGNGFMITGTATDEVAHATSEFSPTIELIYMEDCTNGIDDDGDGLIDCEDQGCPGGSTVINVQDAP